MADTSNVFAIALGLLAALAASGVTAAEVEVTASTSTLVERMGDTDEVAFSAFIRATGQRVGGVRLTNNKPRAAVRLPSDRELLIRGSRVVQSSGKIAFCNGEAYLVFSVDLRYEITFDFEHNSASPTLSRCKGKLVALDASGVEVSVLNLVTAIVDEALPPGSRTLR